MATAADIILSARYEIRDEEAKEFSDAMLLNFLNRGVQPLSAALVRIKSDWVNDTENITLSSGNSSETLPALFVSDITVRIGTSYLVKKSVSTVRHMLVLSSAGQPENYAIRNTTIMFDKEANADYTVVLEYNKKEDTLLATADMPYNDDFNDTLRSFIVLCATSSANERVLNEASINQFFYASLFSKTIDRTHISNIYETDF